MDPAIGTTAQVAAALAIPQGTIRRWASLGWIVRVGTAWPPRYDANHVARVRDYCQALERGDTPEIDPRCNAVTCGERMVCQSGP